MTTEANRDEARKCVVLARRALEAGELDKAERYANKAQRLYASMEVRQLSLQKHANLPVAILKGPHTFTTRRHKLC
jgi:hypothetical protein